MVCLCKGAGGGYSGGHVGGVTATPCALLRVCCTCFLSEHYYIFIEIVIFRGTGVVTAVCKINNSKATDEEKESGLIIKQFACSLPWGVLSLSCWKVTFFPEIKYEVTIPKVHTKAVGN